MSKRRPHKISRELSNGLSLKIRTTKNKLWEMVSFIITPKIIRLHSLAHLNQETQKNVRFYTAFSE